MVQKKRVVFISWIIVLIGFWAIATASPAQPASMPPGRFEPIKLADHPEAAACEVGPDGHLYVISCQRRPNSKSQLTRYRLDARGEYTGQREVVYTWADTEDLALGLAFVPEATTEKMAAYVSVNHGYRSQNNGHLTNLWGGRIERLTIPAKGKVHVEKVIVNFAIGFHALNDLTFGPDGLLYICAGSTTTSGGAGVNTAEHPEQLLSAAILQADLKKINKILDVKTAAGGKYNPYAKDAPVKLFATAIRQPWDCAWHPNGKLYGCTNQNDVNGRTGGGPGVPDLLNIKPPEYLAIMEPGRTFGFPNPSRGEYVLMGGNPGTGKSGFWNILQYPAGIKPPKTWDSSLLHRIDNIGGGSADGIIVYRAPGPHQGKLMVCFFGNNGKGRIWTFTLGADGRVIAQEPLKDLQSKEISIWDCLDLCEHPTHGHLYVSKYGSQNGLGTDGQVWMLRRQEPIAGKHLVYDPSKFETTARVLGNAPPIVDAGEDVETIVAEFPVALGLEGDVQDDGPLDKLKTQWAVESNASGGNVTIDNPQSLETRVTIADPGRYTFKLTADDGEIESSAVCTVVADVPGNQPPVVSLGQFSRTIKVGQPLKLIGVASDDGLPRKPGQLRYTWSRLGPGVGVATFAQPDGKETLVTFSEPAVYLLQFTADDGVRTSFVQTTVTVLPKR